METDALITFDSARTIIKECDDFIKDETGGILVGTLAKPFTVVMAGPPGKNSQHHAYSFTSDPQADNECLNKARQQYGNWITLTGYWHKHPVDLITPSGGDCRQVRQLAADYNDGKPILIGIVNQYKRLTGRKTTLHLYGVDPAGKLNEYSWKLVNHKSQKLLDAISTAPAIPDLSQMDYWFDKDFQSYVTPKGRDRIKQEIEALKNNGWQVRTSRHKDDNLLLLDVRKSSIALILLIPPEFPLNPPLVTTFEGRYFTGLKTLSQWNSLCRLVDVAEEAADIAGCRRCSERYIQQHDCSIVNNNLSRSMQ